MAEVSISQVDLAKSPSELITKENLKGIKIGSASFVFFSEFPFIFTLGEGLGREGQAKACSLRICPLKINLDSTNSALDEFGDFTEFSHFKKYLLETL